MSTRSSTRQKTTLLKLGNHLPIGERYMRHGRVELGESGGLSIQELRRDGCEVQTRY